ncbi:hypothetical protein HU200_064887 [Digitaria exilis]|uniref:Uncharacterized protein n=1 Tax=Digitaria exilis TaxID=1010633 RepID=A0A835DV31_9POAL|nr:hypothetical protein HU200_064887 [Digitaria exilis]
MYRVFTGPAGDKLGCAYVGLHFALYLARVLSLAPVPGWDLVWGPVHFVLQCICYTATTLVACIFIRSYMNVDGVYAEEFDPQVAAPPPSAAAAEEHQLPPPPPEMDMCYCYGINVENGTPNVSWLYWTVVYLLYISVSLSDSMVCLQDLTVTQRERFVPQRIEIGFSRKRRGALMMKMIRLATGEVDQKAGVGTRKKMVQLLGTQDVELDSVQFDLEMFGILAFDGV